METIKIDSLIGLRRFYATPRHEPFEDDKVQALVEIMLANNWPGQAFLVIEHTNEILNGSHRFAAIEAIQDMRDLPEHMDDYQVPVVYVDEDLLTDDICEAADDYDLLDYFTEIGDERAASIIRAEIDHNELETKLVTPMAKIIE